MAALAGVCVMTALVIDDSKLPCELRQCSESSLVCLEYHTDCPDGIGVVFSSRCTKRLPLQCSACDDGVCVQNTDDRSVYCREKYQKSEEEKLMAAANFFEDCTKDSDKSRRSSDYEEDEEDDDDYDYYNGTNSTYY